MQRVAFILRVKEGHEEEYIRRHREIWPQILDDLERARVHKMSIFMSGLQLFLYMEVEDYAEAARVLGDSPESMRWEEYMAPIMEDASGGDYDPQNAYPDGLPEVFYWESRGGNSSPKGTNRE
jgi:L-rhamnose mutarotase